MVRQGVVVLVISVGFLLPGLTRAQEPIPGRWWYLPMFYKAVQLSDKERQELDEHFFQNRTKLIELKSETELAQLELERLLDQEPLDEKALNQQFEKLTEGKNRLSLEAFRFVVQMRRILGFERFQKTKAVYAKLRMQGIKGPLEQDN